MKESEKQILSSYIEDINKTLKEAKQAEERGDLYTAASHYFYTAFMTTYTCLLSKVLISNKPKAELLNIVDNYIEKTSSILNNLNRSLTSIDKKQMTASELQALVASLIRFKEAEENLDLLTQARKELQYTLLNMKLIENILLKTAYTYYRSVTSAQWLKMAERASALVDEEKVTIDRLSFAVRVLAYHAYSTFAYLESLGIPLGKDIYENIEHIQLLLSESSQDANSILYALALSVDSISQMSSKIYMLFSNPEYALNTSSRSLSFLYYKVIERNITPLLPLLYREFAKYARSTISAVQLYTKASTYALLLLLSSEPQRIESQTTETPEETTTPTTIVSTITNTVTSTVKETITITETLTSNTTIRETTTITKTQPREVTPPTNQLLAYILISILAFLAGIVFSRKS